jgi:hypothetical protein
VLDVNGTPIERTWQLVHSRFKQLSPTCLAFRRFLLEHAEPFLEAEYAQFALRRGKRAQGELIGGGVGPVNTV